MGARSGAVFLHRGGRPAPHARRAKLPPRGSPRGGVPAKRGGGVLRDAGVGGGAPGARVLRRWCCAPPSLASQRRARRACPPLPPHLSGPRLTPSLPPGVGGDRSTLLHACPARPGQWGGEVPAVSKRPARYAATYAAHDHSVVTLAAPAAAHTPACPGHPSHASEMHVPTSTSCTTVFTLLMNSGCTSGAGAVGARPSLAPPPPLSCAAAAAAVSPLLLLLLLLPAADTGPRRKNSAAPGQRQPSDWARAAPSGWAPSRWPSRTPGR